MILYKYTLVLCFYILSISLIQHNSQAVIQTKYSFPKDHLAHKGYQVEWWYYTGHIKTKDNKEFGYELTFFKVEVDNKKHKTFHKWKAKPILMAHFAISDKTNKLFYYSEKINRPIGNIAGASEANKFHIWNENWQAYLENSNYYLNASMKNFSIKLILTPLKPPVVHGNDGISKKGLEKDNFSYYYSMTRLETKGVLINNNKEYQIEGISWLDHEWMNNRKYSKHPRWDWFSIQLDNNTEIMFYLIRDKNNNIKSVSQGTIYFSSNKKETITLKDVQINVLKYWVSKKSKAKYPIEWNLNINTKNNTSSQKHTLINLNIKPYFEDQELITSKSTNVIYWEGCVFVKGKMDNEEISGKGYVEMTGYSTK